MRVRIYVSACMRPYEFAYMDGYVRVSTCMRVYAWLMYPSIHNNINRI